jgi:GTP-binding protein
MLKISFFFIFLNFFPKFSLLFCLVRLSLLFCFLSSPSSSYEEEQLVLREKMRSCSMMMLNIIARRTKTAIRFARTSTSTTRSTIAAATTHTTSLCSSSQRRYLVRRLTSSLGCSTSSDSNSSLNSSSFSQSDDDANDDEEEGKGAYYYDDDDINDSEEDLDLENDYVELQLAKQAKAATIKSAKFISSVVRHQDCPQTKLPEVAFIGRSNVGKSSLVNMLTNRKNVAKVSKNPGKTQTINHYEITTGDGKWFLVDLPGYGFANAPEHLKKEWAKFTREYLLERKNLISVMLLVDSTVKPQQLDLDALEFLAENDIPATVVFTKADKKRKAKGGKRATPAEHVDMFADEISEMFEELPPFVFTSANSGEGKKELLNHIATIREFMKNGGDGEDQAFSDED